jgi:hypothetical protein
MKERKLNFLTNGVLIVICYGALLCTGCSGNKQDAQTQQLLQELKLLNSSMSDYLAINKKFVLNAERADYIDSIYNLGDLLIEQIDRQQIDTATLNYLIRRAIHWNEKTRAYFVIEPSSLNNELYRAVAQQKIRMLQTTWLMERLELILLGSYQCEGIGLYPIKTNQWSKFKVGGSYQLDFFIQYQTFGVPQPVVTINGDTLTKKDDSPIYTYTFRPTQKGKVALKRKISIYKWGEMEDVDFSDPSGIMELEVE